MKVSQIKLNPNNPRTIKGEKLELLKKSITEFEKMMELRPIVIDENNIVLGGNMRVSAIKALGRKEVPETWIKRAENLTEEEKREFIIKDNAGFGEWDWDLLANGWDDLPITEWGVDVPDFEIETAPLEEDESQVAETISKAKELQEKWGTQENQLWILKDHRLLIGDSTKKANVERLFGDKKASLLFTSPPYADQRDYDGEADLSVEHLVKFISAFYPFAEYQVINLGLKRKDHEIVEYWQDYIIEARHCGYKFLSWNVWKKNTVQIGQQSAFFPVYHEWLFVFGKAFKDINRTVERRTEISNKKTRKSRQSDGTTKESTIGFQGALKEMESVFISNPELGAIREMHSATFPVELPSAYIEAMTDKGDLVAEPFCGSGTTLIACEQLNRKCRAIEIAPEYVAVTLERWANLTGKTPELIDE